MNIWGRMQSWFVSGDEDKVPLTPEFGEAALADTLNRLFTDPTKAFVRYNPSQLVQRKGLEVYAAMGRDDQIKAALAFKRYAVTAAGWEVTSPLDKSKDWEPRVVVEQQLRNLDHTIEKAIDEVLSALDYGFSVSEKVWKQDGKYIELHDLKTRSPHNMFFVQDGFGNISELKQIREPLPIDKFLIYTHDSRFSNPYGTSDLEAAYRSWWIKDNTYKWMAMLLERMGIPPIFLLYDQSLQGQKEALKKVLKNLQAATTAILPRTNKDSLELWSPELAGNIHQVFIPALKQFNEDIARAILLPGLLGFTPDSGAGSLARSETHFDSFMLIVERIRLFVQIKVNRALVHDIVDFNFAVQPNEYPEFKFLPLSGEMKNDLFTLWADMVSKKIVRPTEEDEAHVRSALRFPDAGGKPMPVPEPAPGFAPDGTPLPPQPGQKPQPFDKLSLKAYAVQTSVEAAGKLMNRAHDDIAHGARDALLATRDALLAAVRKEGKATNKLADTLNLRRLGDLRDAFEHGLRDIYDAGRGSVRPHALEYRFTPREAVQYFKRKAVEIAGIIDADLTGKAKLILLDAVKNGEPLGDTMLKLGLAFVQYLGDPSAVDDVAVLEGARLETIVRTNVTDAFNQGRLNAALDPDLAPFLYGVQYSAILDERTTEVCNYLHGRIFRIDDPALSRLVPPNHFNCRSLVVPITKASAHDQGFGSDKFITPAEVGRAAELAGKGFYSLTAPDGAWSNYVEVKDANA